MILSIQHFVLMKRQVQHRLSVSIMFLSVKNTKSKKHGFLHIITFTFFLLFSNIRIHQQVDNATYHSDSFTTPAKPSTYLPLLSEVLDAICPTGKQVIIELKANGERDGIGPAVIKLLEKKHRFDCVHAFSSFYWKKCSNLLFLSHFIFSSFYLPLS